MTCCGPGTLKQEKTQEVKELETSIKDMDKDSTKDTAKRKNEDKQAEAKLQGLEQENTKLQEEISKLTKDKASRSKEDEKASKQVKREQNKKVETKFPCFLLLNTF